MIVCSFEEVHVICFVMEMVALPENRNGNSHKLSMADLAMPKAAAKNSRYSKTFRSS